MVVKIVANILNQEIFIIERPTFSEYCVTVVSPKENNSQMYTNMAEESPLVLLKTGLYYDACVPVCARPTFRLYQASDFIHVSMNQGRLKCSTENVLCALCDIYDMKNLVMGPTCFKCETPTFFVFLTNKPNCFCQSINIDT